MRFSSTCLFVFSISLASCSSHLAVSSQDKYEQSVALREIREELADIKHGLNNTQVELHILEEQCRSKENDYKKINISSSQDIKVSALEKKVSLLSTNVGQTADYLNECRAKILELEKIVEHQNSLLTEIISLKSSLSSLTSSLQKNKHSTTSTYKVKAGDSLEKIARIYKVSLQSLKEENNLSSTKIIVGQELKIPGSSS